MPYKPGTNPVDPYNQDAESSAQSSGWGDIAYNAAELAAGFVPGVGEAIDIKNAYQSYQQGDYLGAGISAGSAVVGLVPFAGDAIATGARAFNRARKVRETNLGKANLVKDTALAGFGAEQLGQDIAEQRLQDQGLAAGQLPPNPALDAFGGTGAAVDLGVPEPEPIPPTSQAYVPPEQRTEGIDHSTTVDLYDPGTTREDYEQARSVVYHTDDDGNDYTGHGTSFGRETAVEYGDTTGQGEFGGTPTSRNDNDDSGGGGGGK